MLARIKIGARLGAAFGLLVALLIAMVIAGSAGLGSIQRTAQSLLDEEVALATNAQLIQRLALEERRYEKDTFINIGSPDKVSSYHDKWNAARQRLADALLAGQQLAPNAKLRANYTEADAALKDYAAGYESTYQAIMAGEIDATARANAAFGQFKDAIYRLESMAEAIEKAADERMGLASGRIAGQYRSALISLLGFAGVAIALAIVLAIVITRSIVHPVRRALNAARRVADGDLRETIQVTGRDEMSELLAAMATMSRSLSILVTALRQSSESVLTGADEVALGSQDLATRTEEQASAVQQTAASMEEMTATARQNTESTREASELASEASSSSRNGAEEVDRSIALMQVIATESHKMNGIIEAIDSIAFQTNILALNASVEAARAGERGRGFAVVAAEVRTLASRSADSASEIRNMLEGTRRKIEECAAQAQRGGKTINQTEALIQKLASYMQGVSTATAEQIAGIEQVNDAIAQIDTTTQQNSALVEESSTAAASLKEQAQRLKAMVSKFRVIDTHELPGSSSIEPPVKAAGRTPSLVSLA